MPGRPGASGQERPGLKKYRFLIEIIEKINGFECRGVRERAARSGRDRKSIDSSLKSIRKSTVSSAGASGSGQERPGLKKYRFLIEIIKKINGFESRGVRERAARRSQD